MKISFIHSFNSNLDQVWNFFRLTFHNCLSSPDNCDDKSSIYNIAINIIQLLEFNFLSTHWLIFILSKSSDTSNPGCGNSSIT